MNYTIDELLSTLVLTLYIDVVLSLSTTCFTSYLCQLLTHWGWDKMAAVFQTFWNAFSWMKMYKFQSRFHWNSLRFVRNWQYTSIGSDNGLAPSRRQAIIWTSDGLFTDTYIYVTLPQWVDCQWSIGIAYCESILIDSMELWSNYSASWPNKLARIRLFMLHGGLFQCYFLEIYSTQFIILKIAPVPVKQCMMTSSNGNIIRVTGHLCREFTGHRWIPCTKASDM